MSNTNIELKEGFTQVCVWPGTTIEGSNAAEFEEFMAENFGGARVQYLENILTAPDKTPSGEVVPGTGGRDDLFFAVHSADVMKFAIPRLSYGVRWIEDVYGNGNGYLYPERVAGYKSWDAGDGSQDVEES